MENDVFGKAVTELFLKRKAPRLIDVPKRKMLMFNGKGHPQSEDFQKACDALFSVSYILKFKIARARLNLDYKVMPLEVTWHLDKSQKPILFTWEAMIMQANFVNEEYLKESINMAYKKNPSGAYDRLYIEELKPTKVIAALHTGDYNLMNDTLCNMKKFSQDNGILSEDYTHDIYLNDSRKTKTENLKAIMYIKVIN